MKSLRHPLILCALVVVSCWGAFELGKKPQSKKESVSNEERAPANRSWFREARNDREQTRSLQDELDECVSANDFREAINRLQFQADKTEENRLLSVLFQRWLEVSPIDALAEVRRVENLRHDILRTSRVFETWAFENPNEVRLLLKEILDGRQRDSASRPPFLDGVDPPEYVLSLVSGLAKADPNSTANLLGEMSESPVRFHALDVLLQNWFPQDADAAFRWAERLEEGSLRNQVISKAATKAGQADDPKLGIAWAQSLETSAEQRVALGSLTRQWAARHSREAFQWVVLQEDDLKFHLVPPVISSLMKVDPGAAADWLNQFEASPRMDPAVASYAEALSSVNPTAAMDSATAITEESLREKVMLRIAKDWKQTTPKGFRAYLDQREGLPLSVYELIR